MGILDQREASTWDLPNFDSSFSPPRSVLENNSKQHEDSLAKRVDSTATSNADTSSKSSMTAATRPKLKQSASTANPTRASATTSTRQPQSKPRRATIAATKRDPGQRRRSSAQPFDLYGEDAALQDAVPRIHFCDICLCACDIH